ncbi:hypothetical protein A5784_00870 [Mycobacterium sp. 852013-50091_SCH5140682]|uniref:hypothetical protein n=1 Tax=Mycobacterium sp. 852013-50091_SCH5140682 TaxID=1834109 RepID=UPI0007EB8EBD|nr:hypothetical protein [Mycobacterium sp. 852013-50091_SCH5140682]OBC09270.1 hypothetical protein A5784_00870 [Mycobacterium sp. 852013-50091_SCH5140682]
MAWTKIPAAAASIACAACIAAATAVPGAEMQAAHLAKAVSGDVRLSADFLQLTQLDSLNGIPALLEFLVTQDPWAFVPVSDDPTTPDVDESWPGYAALSALWNYQNLLGGDLGYDGLSGIAAFDAIPIYLSGPDAILTYSAAVNGIPGYVNALGGDFTGVSVFDGITSFQNFPTQGLDAFVPVEDDPTTPDVNESQAGYAALSGLASYRDFIESGGDVTKLAGIDAFSAIPNWKNFIESGGQDVSSDGLGGIDAFSAIPVYKAALTTDPPEETADVAGETDDQGAAAKVALNKNVVTEKSDIEPNKVPTLSNPVAAMSNVTPPAAESVEAGAPAAAPAAPEAASAPAAADTSSGSSGKQSNGSYSGVFKPNNPVVLFGTGKGGGADNGIRGWDKVANGIRGALGLPKDNSGSGDSGSSSGAE